MVSPVSFAELRGSWLNLAELFVPAIKGKFRLGSRFVALEKIRCPLFNIAARYDHLIPEKSTTAMQHVYAGTEYKQVVFPSSQVGLSAGRRAHEELWPQVSRWARERRKSFARK